MEFYKKISYKYINGEFWHGRILTLGDDGTFDRTYKRGEEAQYRRDLESYCDDEILWKEVADGVQGEGQTEAQVTE